MEDNEGGCSISKEFIEYAGLSLSVEILATRSLISIVNKPSEMRSRILKEPLYDASSDFLIASSLTNTYEQVCKLSLCMKGLGLIWYAELTHIDSKF